MKAIGDERFDLVAEAFGFVKEDFDPVKEVDALTAFAVIGECREGACRYAVERCGS